MKTILTLIAAAATLAVTTGTTHAANYTAEDAIVSGSHKTYRVKVKFGHHWVCKYYGCSYHTARSIAHRYRCKGYCVSFY